MDYAIVLNALSGTFTERAEELAGFITSRIEGLSEVGGKPSAVLFHDGALDAGEPAEYLRLPVENLFLIKMDTYSPEVALEELGKIAGEIAVELYIFPGDYSGTELAVRFAARSGGSALTMVSRVEISGEELYCERPVYSSHLRGRFEMFQKPCCISIEHGAAEPKKLETKTELREERLIRIDASEKRPTFVAGTRFFKEKIVDPLEHARFLMAAGRGVGKKESCESLREKAEGMGAEFGVSRLAAMNGWAPMERMIGVSGAILKPELCIIVAASGAAAFMAGVEKSGFILSVNTDPKAPVFRQSDVGVLEDYEAFMEALAKIIEEEGPREVS